MKYRFANPEERLRDVFESGFTARDIASALASFDADTPSSTAHAVMTEEAFKLAGVRVRGQIAGSIDRDELIGGTCGDYLHRFTPDATVQHTASFSEVVDIAHDMEATLALVRGTDQI